MTHQPENLSSTHQEIDYAQIGEIIDPMRDDIDNGNHFDEKQLSRTQRVFEFTKRNWRKIALGVGLGVTAVVGANTIAGEDEGILKKADIAEVGRDAIEVLEVAAPIVLGGAFVHAVTLPIGGTERRTQAKLAIRGLAPSDSRKFRELAVKGALLPALGIGALATAFMIEDGIHTGADNNIASIEATASSAFPNSKVSWFVEDGTNHFMNDSDVESYTYNLAQNYAMFHPDKFFGVAPFERDLVTLPTPYSENQASMIFAVDSSGPGRYIVPELKPGAECDFDDSGVCLLRPGEIILDEGEGYNIGDTVTIRGEDLKVVGFPKEDQSLVNRLVAFRGADFSEGSDNYYGFVGVSGNKEDADTLLNQIDGGDKLQALSTDEFIERNNDFWSHNGTPLLILMIGDTAIFAAATFSSMKKFEHERTMSALSTLRAIGASRRQITEQEYARTTMTTAKGIVPGTMGALVTTMFINNSLPGFEGNIDLKKVAAATGIVFGAQAISTARGLRTINKMSPVDAMRN